MVSRGLMISVPAENGNRVGTASTRELPNGATVRSLLKSRGESRSGGRRGGAPVNPFCGEIQKSSISPDSPFYRRPVSSRFAGEWGALRKHENSFLSSETDMMMEDDSNRNSRPGSAIFPMDSTSRKTRPPLEMESATLMSTMSVTKETYSRDPLAVMRETVSSRHQKFRTLRANGSTVLSVSLTGVKANENDARIEERSPFNYHGGLSTTIRDSYIPPSSQTSPYGNQGNAFSHTAADRAATRLTGERLNLCDDSHRNTLAQRSWLYTSDPAIKVRLADGGKPDTTMQFVSAGDSMGLPSEINQASEQAALTLGVKKNENVQKSYARRYVVSGDILSKTGARRAGIFLDENEV